MQRVRIIDTDGIAKYCTTVSSVKLKNKKFNKIEKIPIIIAVIIANRKVARVFSIQDLLEKFPIMRSREVLAIKGPLRFPLNERSAGMIRIRAIKESKGIIKRERIMPAKISPIIETDSDGKVSLIILPLVSCISIFILIVNYSHK